MLQHFAPQRVLALFGYKKIERTPVLTERQH